MADNKQDSQSHRPQGFPSRFEQENGSGFTPSGAQQWISPTSSQSRKPIAKKSILARQLEDEIALEKYAKENTPPPKKTNHNRVIAISIMLILVFIFTLGGNLVDLATGGDGSHSWYGKDGVYNRFMLSEEIANRAGTDDDKKLAESLKSNKAVISNAAPTTANAHTEVRIVNPPKNEVAAKPLPSQSYKVAEFLSADLKVQCQISDVVECSILDFAGQLGQKTGHAVSLTLGPNGVQHPKDLGKDTSFTGAYALSTGATATSGDYACTAVDSHSIDCWNLKTGKGMIISQSSAEGYNTSYKSSNQDAKQNQ